MVVTTRELPGLDEEEQLRARVAWYYYVGNLTQQQIANRLGTSRVRINRLLAACRDNGVVQITINSRLATCVALEQQLRDTFALTDAVVVPTPDDSELVRAAVGVGAGAWLSRHVADGMTVGLGWGRTVHAILRALEPRSRRNLSVVALQGGLSHCSGINTFEIVSAFAGLFGADQYFFAAPIYASSEDARDLILRQNAIRQSYDKARSADLAVVACGDLGGSLVITYGLDDPHDLAQLQAMGAVGDLLGHFIDAAGQRVNHPLNRRTVAVDLDDLHHIDRVMLVSGGLQKRTITTAVLRGGYADVLVTDEKLAAALVE